MPRILLKTLDLWIFFFLLITFLLSRLCSMETLRMKSVIITESRNLSLLQPHITDGIYLIQAHNIKTKATRKNCWKLTIKTPEQRDLLWTNFTRCFFHCWLWTNKCRLGSVPNQWNQPDLLNLRIYLQYKSM